MWFDVVGQIQCGLSEGEMVCGKHMSCQNRCGAGFAETDAGLVETNAGCFEAGVWLVETDEEKCSLIQYITLYFHHESQTTFSSFVHFLRYFETHHDSLVICFVGNFQSRCSS